MTKLFKYYLKYLPLILLTIALLFAEAYCDLQLPTQMTRIMNEGIFQSDMGAIWKIGLLMLGYSLIVTVCSIGVSYLAAYIGAKASGRMRRDMFDKISHFSEHEMDKFTVASLITRTTNDVTQVQMFIIMLIRMAFYAPIMAIGGIIQAVQMSAGMSDLVLVIVVGVAVILSVIIVLLLIVQPRFTKLQKIIDKLNLVARESLNGMMVIRAFNTQEFEEQKFDTVNKDLYKIQLFVNRIMSFLMPVIMIVMNGISIAVIWIASYSAGDIDQVMNMMAFIQYAMQIIMSFMMVIFVFILLPRASVSAKRIAEVLGTEISIKDGRQAGGAVSVSYDTVDGDVPAGDSASEKRGVVKYDNVCFKYAGSEDYVIDHISFEADPGTVTAIIGGTGSGKSSLIKLLPRMYDVTEGSVTVDGKDVREMPLDKLRDTIAYVPQKNVLFSGTIESNIKYSDESASGEQMQRAADIAQASEFISTKEDGYQSPIAQGGDNVSGGQKQRLAIARAILKESPVCVFDDSFSALDFKTDKNLRKALKENLTDATIIIVAQRVGTILDADQILVLDHGRLAGKGTHKELMQNCEIYRDIARSQLSEEELGL